MMRKIFILVPSAHPTGPIKGAYALANALALEREVTIVHLKSGPGVDTHLNKQIVTVFLDKSDIHSNKLKHYRELLTGAGNRDTLASISLCYSADNINSKCKDIAITCSSVRGNLFINYRHDYGLAGFGLAIIHLTMLRRMDHVVAMSESMRCKIQPFTGKKISVIGNFVDESHINQYRTLRKITVPYRFVFVGSLSTRKRPDLLMTAMEKLLEKQIPIHLDVIGDGPLRSILQEHPVVKTYKAATIHGHLDDPLPIVASSDIFILPSLSEGISRAALEALCLGVHCVLKNVEGNAEIIKQNINGILFDQDETLPDAILQAIELRRSKPDESRKTFIPKKFRQRLASNQYIKLIESE